MDAARDIHTPLPQLRLRTEKRQQPIEQRREIHTWNLLFQVAVLD